MTYRKPAKPPRNKRRDMDRLKAARDERDREGAEEESDMDTRGRDQRAEQEAEDQVKRCTKRRGLRNRKARKR